MKQIAKTNTSIEAEMIKGLLAKNSIESVIEGSREYTSHLLGSTDGVYLIYVNEQFEEQAKKIIGGVKISLVDAIDESVQSATPDYFKKAIFCALIGTMFPVLFHYYAFQHFGNYWKAESHASRKTFALLLFLLICSLGFIVTLMYAQIIFRMFK
jgi:hypothetical protein